MMMSNLPPDLIEEILSRVPAISLKRLRSTCRLWNTLIKDQRFTEKHFHKAAKESMILMLKHYRVFSMSVSLNVTPPSIAFQGALGLKDSHSDSEQVDIIYVFHCDGLLLCTTKDNRLVVWNPCLGETKWIKLKTGSERYGSKFALGYIQNTKSDRSYKILRWWNNYDHRCEIYEFISDSWRVLDDVILDSIIQGNGYIGSPSSLKGNTYWVAVKEDNEFLLSFDFRKERSKHMCLPLFQNLGSVTLSVGRKEQLSVLNWSYRNLEMWVTNRIDAEAELLWNKSFIVDLPTDTNSLCIFTTLLIDEEKKVSLCCTLRNLVYTIGEDNEYYTEIPYTNNLWWSDEKWRPCIFHYVPSLLQIQQK